jgi:hypothetical protein
MMVKKAVSRDLRLSILHTLLGILLIYNIGSIGHMMGVTTIVHPKISMPMLSAKRIAFASSLIP